MLKIRRPLGRLIFNMGIAIPGKTVFLIETAPRPQRNSQHSGWLKSQAIFMTRSFFFLIHWGQDKTDAIFPNAFSWMKMYELWLKFQWNLFWWVQLTIFQLWFRWWLGIDQAISHYLNQWWSVQWRIRVTQKPCQLKLTIFKVCQFPKVITISPSNHFYKQSSNIHHHTLYHKTDWKLYIQTMISQSVFEISNKGSFYWIIIFLAIHWKQRFVIRTVLPSLWSSSSYGWLSARLQ